MVNYSISTRKYFWDCFGCIALVIFLYKYFDNGSFRNIAIGLFLLGGIGSILMSWENDKNNTKKMNK